MAPFTLVIAENPVSSRSLKLSCISCVGACLNSMRRLAKLKKMGVCPQSDERPALCPDALHDLMETCWKQEP
eukprot:6473819-Amphidinium_carterae.1